MKKIICIVFVIFYPFIVGAEITPQEILQKAVSGKYDPVCDINKDGRINSLDALLLLMKRKSNIQEVKYTYDTLDRLIQCEYKWGIIEYKYDSCGNRTEIKSLLQRH